MFIFNNLHAKPPLFGHMSFFIIERIVMMGKVNLLEEYKKYEQKITLSAVNHYWLKLLWDFINDD